jgi:uncharacterized oxidoreductase
MDISGKRVLITGGSSGIGLALANRFGKAGSNVALAGRSPDRLDRAVAELRADGISASKIVADIGTSEGRKAVAAAAAEILGGIDVLVNNAGAVKAGRLESLSDRDIEAMMNTNLVGPILLTRDLLPVLRTSGDALIVNVSSSMGLVGMPFYSVYAGVKAGVARFGDALRRELNGEGIRVLNVFPVATDTPMMRSSRMAVTLESTETLVDAIVAGIRSDAIQIVRGGEARRQMIELDRTNAAELDRRLGAQKDGMEKAVENHESL